MKRDIAPAEVLNALLSDWHAWGRDRLANGLDRVAALPPAATRGGWDSADDETDQKLHASTMRTVDFHVSGDAKGQGGMPEPHRSAIYALARNCWAGSSVWSSPRLPRDSMARNVITQEARIMLSGKLQAAGVL